MSNKAHPWCWLIKSQDLRLRVRQTTDERHLRNVHRPWTEGAKTDGMIVGGKAAGPRAAAGAMGDGVVVYGDNGTGGGNYVCDLVRRAGVGRRPGVRSE